MYSRDNELILNQLTIEIYRNCDTESIVICGDNELILNQLTIEMYRNCDTESIVICGDFNSRIGDKQDCQSIDGVTDRVSIDPVVNQQGLKFLSFVNDIRGCIVNGRIDSLKDDYTSVTSHKGRAVVDYFVVCHNEISAVKGFQVKSCRDIINECGLISFLDGRITIPDHSVLSLTLEMLMIIHEGLTCRNIATHNYGQRSKIYRKVGELYMNSSTACKLIPEMLEQLKTMGDTQTEINDMYAQISDLILSEAENSLSAEGKKRKHTLYKPYWNSELTCKWKIMHECERTDRAVCRHEESPMVCKNSKKEFHTAQ